MTIYDAYNRVIQLGDRVFYNHDGIDTEGRVVMIVDGSDIITLKTADKECIEKKSSECVLKNKDI